MTLENLYSFMTGLGISALAAYIISLAKSYKKIAKQRSELENAKVSFNNWEGRHFPRLEDMF